MRSIAVIALMGQVVLGQQFTNSSTSSTTSSTTLSTLSTSRTSTTTTTTTLITTTDSITDDGGLTFPPETTTTDTTGTSTTVTTTSTSSSASSTSTVSPNPANFGGFTLLGCYGSPTSFPGFTLALSAESMTIDRCITTCNPTGRRYAALFGSDCFCGDSIDDINEPLRPEAECNFPCPGNPRQRCGGRSTALLRNKRQILPTDVRFTIYVRVGGVISVSGTVTVTVSTGTNGVIGTATSTATPSPNPCFNGKCFGVPCFGLDCYKKFVAYGDFCGYDFPCFGPDCRKRLVWEHGVWRPDACNGWDCGRKFKCISGKCKVVVKGSDWDKEKIICYGNICKVQKCEGDECNKKYVCKDKSCVFETCPKEDGNKKWECESDKCKIVKPCEDDCPEPAPPGPLPTIGTALSITRTRTRDIDITVRPEPTSTDEDSGRPGPEIQPTDEPAIQPTDEPVASILPIPTDEPEIQPTEGAPGPDGPAPTATSTEGTQPSVVVVAGSNKFVASFGALAFSVIAAAILL
ncbi:hypothetical protein CH063_09441 [Colletotrichum higginsianum]|uniref:Wsc domain-containing protein n=2 Tax=Colletotrichum higginsianum TaxID=80884 RepID=H1VDM6_COLHI|nr:Wsc domain-containing protein [Colletotrichum higginsianum IMI 349063]OBR11374.1 Wsc domain-containing protein [Colletotrichum higginsianum IMI 349063]TIC98941.1 hypothetical protein CH35J_006424 [Colletotrichum higginsianum]GJC93025.1 Wsc domain-containing protein [Colletotrichum higginsianum]CCF38329.1 hypothetical protein CH063_09441 [Colletotrichum higginsianum]